DSTQDDDDIEHAPGVRQGMYFLVSDSGQRSDDHVETVEPGPSLDVVKAERAEADHEGERGRDELEIAGSPHRSIVGGCDVEFSDRQFGTSTIQRGRLVPRVPRLLRCFIMPALIPRPTRIESAG